MTLLRQGFGMYFFAKQTHIDAGFMKRECYPKNKVLITRLRFGLWSRYFQHKRNVSNLATLLIRLLSTSTILTHFSCLGKKMQIAQNLITSGLLNV
jgi:hypothetical protein